MAHIWVSPSSHSRRSLLSSRHWRYRQQWSWGSHRVRVTRHEIQNQPSLIFCNISSRAVSQSQRSLCNWHPVSSPLRQLARICRSASICSRNRRSSHQRTEVPRLDRILPHGMQIRRAPTCLYLMDESIRIVSPPTSTTGKFPRPAPALCGNSSCRRQARRYSRCPSSGLHPSS